MFNNTNLPPLKPRYHQCHQEIFTAHCILYSGFATVGSCRASQQLQKHYFRITPVRMTFRTRMRLQGGSHDPTLKSSNINAILAFVLSPFILFVRCMIRGQKHEQRHCLAVYSPPTQHGPDIESIASSQKPYLVLQHTKILTSQIVPNPQEKQSSFHSIPGNSKPRNPSKNGRQPHCKESHRRVTRMVGSTVPRMARRIRHLRPSPHIGMVAKEPPRTVARRILLRRTRPCLFRHQMGISPNLRLGLGARTR